MTEVNENPWDRQPGEPEDAWTAFWRWRDASPRPALAKHAAAVGRSYQAVRGWAVGWGWDARILAWDQAVDAGRQSATMTATQEMAARHIKLSQSVLDVVEHGLRKIKADLSTDFGRLKPQEIARLLEVASKLERLSRGEATERVEGTDYSTLSDEDLGVLEEIAARTGR